MSELQQAEDTLGQREAHEDDPHRASPAILSSMNPIENSRTWSRIRIVHVILRPFGMAVFTERVLRFDDHDVAVPEGGVYHVLSRSS